jgi:hypothetical protein
MSETSLKRTRTSAERLIAAFPATGKTYYAKQHGQDVFDSDSSQFSWVVNNGEKVRHPDWPQNYLRHIKAELRAGNTVLVSTHAEVRGLLEDEELPFTLVYPREPHRVEYIVRMAQRGSPLALIELIDKNWCVWIEEMHEQACAIRYELGAGDYLSDVIA